jgi:hypothetical protein
MTKKAVFVLNTAFFLLNRVTRGREPNVLSPSIL